MKKYIFVLLVLAMPQLVSAQYTEACFHRSAKMDSIGSKRAAFLIEELNLTAKESEAFVPLVDEYIKARFSLFIGHHKSVSDMRKKETKTTADYNAIMDDHLQSETKKLDLEKQFYVDMRKVLPAEKAYKYKRAEHLFMNKLMDGKQKRHSKPRGRYSAPKSK